MRAVILAAGEGTRLRPLTLTRPKCMLPIGNKPVIGHLVEKLNRLGMEMAVVISPKDTQTKKLLGDSVTWCYQAKAKGTATALRCARNFVTDTFLCVYGDIYTTLDFKEVIGLKEPVICAKWVVDVSPFGEVISRAGKLIGLREKMGSGPGLANMGVYLLTPDIFTTIDELSSSRRGEYELTDAICALNRQRPFLVHNIGEHYWNDVGYPWNLLEANLHFLRQVGDVVVGEGSQVYASATLRGPVLIGTNCQIKNCLIESSVIGNGCVVGEFSIVKRSVIMDHTNVPHLNYVADSLIGSNCNLGAGTVTANLRFDERSVKVKIKGKKVDSGRRKLGVIMGDNCKTGINVSLMPGVKVGPNSVVGPGVVLYEDLGPGQSIFVKR